MQRFGGFMLSFKVENMISTLISIRHSYNCLESPLWASLRGTIRVAHVTPSSSVECL